MKIFPDSAPPLNARVDNWVDYIRDCSDLDVFHCWQVATSHGDARIQDMAWNAMASRFAMRTADAEREASQPGGPPCAQ